MKEDQRKILSIELLETFKQAGSIALELRKKGLKTEIKKDNTPVTNGDIKVNDLLCKKISTLTPDIPIISEENLDNKKKKKFNKFLVNRPN